MNVTPLFIEELCADCDAPAVIRQVDNGVEWGFCDWHKQVPTAIAAIAQCDYDYEMACQRTNRVLRSDVVIDNGTEHGIILSDLALELEFTARAVLRATMNAAYAFDRR